MLAVWDNSTTAQAFGSAAWATLREEHKELRDDKNSQELALIFVRYAGGNVSEEDVNDRLRRQNDRLNVGFAAQLAQVQGKLDRSRTELTTAKATIAEEKKEDGEQGQAIAALQTSVDGLRVALNDERRRHDETKGELEEEKAKPTVGADIQLLINKEKIKAFSEKLELQKEMARVMAELMKVTKEASKERDDRSINSISRRSDGCSDGRMRNRPSSDLYELIDPFNGVGADMASEDFTAWKLAFDLHTTQLNDTAKKAILVDKMKGEAQRTILSLDRETLATFDGLVAELAERYPPRFSNEKAYGIFLITKQVATEMCTTYSNRLRALLDKAKTTERFAYLKEKHAYDSVLRVQFLHGIPRPMFDRLDHKLDDIDGTPLKETLKKCAEYEQQDNYMRLAGVGRQVDHWENRRSGNSNVNPHDDEVKDDGRDDGGDLTPTRYAERRRRAGAHESYVLALRRIGTSTVRVSAEEDRAGDGGDEDDDGGGGGKSFRRFRDDRCVGWCPCVQYSSDDDNKDRKAV